MTTAETEVIDLTGLSDSSDSEDDEERNQGEEAGTEDGSDVSEIELHLDEVSRSQLHAAIATVSEARLRHVLKNLINTDQAVEIALTREFVTVKRDSRAVVPRWERCANCDAEYDVNAAQEDDECSFHPGEFGYSVGRGLLTSETRAGELEVNEEEFVDWDENCHGPMDTTLNRRQYPENFMWSCCDADGTAPGCVVGEHKPVEVSKKRKRD